MALYLLPELWGKGTGHALFKTAMQTLSSNAYLWVLDNNEAAISAYKKWGGEIDTSLKKDAVIGDQPVQEIGIKFNNHFR